MIEKPVKKFPTIGCCGPDFFTKRPSCSFITCCVKKKGLETCAECSDFPCSRFKSEKEYQQMKLSSSYPPDKKILSNLNFIKDNGVQKFIEQQQGRIRFLEIMIKNFDDGRSRSFFCKVAALLELANIQNSINKATQEIKTGKIKQNDVKIKAKILKAIFSEIASKEGLELATKKANIKKVRF